MFRRTITIIGILMAILCITVGAFAGEHTAKQVTPFPGKIIVPFTYDTEDKLFSAFSSAYNAHKSGTMSEHGDGDTILRIGFYDETTKTEWGAYYKRDTHELWYVNMSNYGTFFSGDVGEIYAEYDHQGNLNFLEFYVSCYDYYCFNGKGKLSKTLLVVSDGVEDYIVNCNFLKDEDVDGITVPKGKWYTGSDSYSIDMSVSDKKDFNNYLAIKKITLGEPYNFSKPATDIILKKTKTTIKKGKTIQLKVKSVEPADTKIVWKSSNKKIATVDKKGRVKGKKKGTCTITCTTAEGAKAKCKITVK